ncbi:hypothetical protein [Tardiphaga robiniae]|uniref:PhnA-like protein n=1 Tax=Tardiphaga robiniae TaxID=943830 RepID=A0A163X4G4_9BRAD|nr:hypothetical protein [Tardiphaga robiniae]KZD20400.1 hypothetical protein A4A58_19400 [Tardiphaga robiniae]
MVKSIEPAAASIAVPSRYLSWTPVILGALIATALSSILLAFGVTIGLGVSSTAPTWRDASAALWILSGLYLILQAALSFGVGGYIAGRTNVGLAALDTAEIEQRDGLHGLAAWALAVVLGVALAAFIGSATLTRPNSNSSSARTSAAEPLLSYEIDRLFRPLRRAANVDLLQERAEAGRILLTSSSHSGMSSEDRSYLAQLVAANTGLAGAEAEKRVDAAIATSQASIAKSRRSSVILAFSVAAAILLGAVIAVTAGSVGGSHRDGAAMPHWMGARGSGAAYRREVA